LSRHTVDECLSAGSSVERNVSYYNVFICLKCCAVWWAYDQLSTGESLSKVVVAVSGQFQCKSLRDKCSEALSAGSLTLDHEAVLRESLRISSRDLGTEDRSEGAVRVGNIHLDASLLSLLKGRKKLLYKDSFIQCFIQFKVKHFLRIEDHALLLFCIRVVQYAAQIQSRGPLGGRNILHFQKICASHQFIHCAHAQ